MKHWVSRREKRDARRAVIHWVQTGEGAPPSRGLPRALQLEADNLHEIQVDLRRHAERRKVYLVDGQTYDADFVVPVRQRSGVVVP